MNLVIEGGRLIDPASGLDTQGPLAVADGHIVSVGSVPSGFEASRTLDAKGCVVCPGLVDLSVRLRAPGQAAEGLLASELAAAVAGGVTSVVCPPDAHPVLDVPGLVEMLRYRSERLHLARVFAQGALTRGLQGEALTEMAELTQAGCVGFGQAEVPISSTQVLQRAMQYAATYGYTLWLRPQELYLGRGVAASGPVATRLGLPGVPVVAETIALHTLFELQRATGARLHLCRISSGAGVELVRAAKAHGLPLSCDVSVHNLHLTDVDIGYFDSRMRLTPVLRQQRDRDALRAALADGTIDALVSDHTPVGEDDKALPFGEAEPGASAVELLLSLALQWGREMGLDLPTVLQRVTMGPTRVLGAAQGSPSARTATGLGRLQRGALADVCVFDPEAPWVVGPKTLRSHAHLTPFGGLELRAQVRATLVNGRVAFERG